jgi:general secretion pathway protein G
VVPFFFEKAAMYVNRIIQSGLALILLLSLLGCSHLEWRGEQRQKEAVLKEDLYSLRNAIDQFTQAKEAAPETLDDVVHAGYLRELPVDPFTDSRSTWKITLEDEPLKAGKKPGIVDVHSGSHAISSEGTPYDSW